MTDTPASPVTPRLAATVLLLRDDPFEVLMVKRHERAFFPSALVFPGGTVDDDDWAAHWLPHLTGHEELADQERAQRIAALRETWEEAGILVSPGIAALPAAGATTPFRELVEAAGATLDLADMAHFGHWVTPAMVPKRFDTHFYLARAPHGQDAICDGGETVSLEWVQPADAIARAEAGERSILFSTLANLRRLAESTTIDQAMAAAHARERFTVHPQSEALPGGGRRIFIDEAAGYPQSEWFFAEAPRAAP